MKTDPWAEQKRSYWVRSEVDAIPNNEVQASWVRGTVVDLIEELEQENEALRRVARAAEELRMEAGVIHPNKMWVLRDKYIDLVDALDHVEQHAPWLLEGDPNEE